MNEPKNRQHLGTKFAWALGIMSILVFPAVSKSGRSELQVERGTPKTRQPFLFSSKAREVKYMQDRVRSEKSAATSLKHSAHKLHTSVYHFLSLKNGMIAMQQLKWKCLKVSELKKDVDFTRKCITSNKQTDLKEIFQRQIFKQDKL